jgi:F5/8 type C domain
VESVARFSPFGAEHTIRFDWSPGMSLAAIARRAIKAMEKHVGKPGVYDWFLDVGIIRVCGKAYERTLWAHIKPKPNTIVDLMPPMPGNGKVGRIGLILASVALTVATAGIANGAIATAFGLLESSTFAAGGVGANLAAGLFGFAGSRLLAKLTPRPRLSGEGASRRELSQGGISGNIVARGDYLFAVIGRMRVSPHLIIPSYTTLEGDRIWVHAMAGVAGRCKIEAVKINGIDASAIARLQIETIEGDGGTASSFLSGQTIVDKPLNVVLSEFDTITDKGLNENLSNQTDPNDSLPRWHRLQIPEDAIDFKVRLLCEGGIVSSQTGAAYCVPFRMRMRLKGASTWRNLPTIHMQDSKGSGPFRREITLTRRPVLPGSKSIGRNDDFDICHAFWRTSPGTALEYTADNYFRQDRTKLNNLLPVFTGSTTSGATITATSFYGTFYEPWRAADGDDTTPTYWIPAASSSGIFPQNWQIDWGAGNTKTVRSYGIMNAHAIENSPKSWALLGSLDGTTWVEIHKAAGVPQANVPGGVNSNHYNVDIIAPFRHHRLSFTEVQGPAQTFVALGEVYFSSDDALSLDALGGVLRYAANGSIITAHHVDLKYEGPTIHLRDPEWPTGEYDFEIMRGRPFQFENFDTNSASDPRYTKYYYFDDQLRADFFDYIYAFNTYSISEPVDKIQSKVLLERSIETYDDSPILPSTEAGISRIAIRVPDVAVQSISAIFTKYAREWNGAEWGDDPVPSRNPAAHYRDALLLESLLSEPLPGEIIDEVSLETAFTYAATNGFTCDTVLQGRGVPEVLQLLASSMRAWPRQADMWGLSIDRPRTGETPSAMITPETSRFLGMSIDYEKIPEAMRVTYLDEDFDYEEREITVYRDGFNFGNTKDIRVTEDRASTSAAKATATARYDLRQEDFRRNPCEYEVGFEGRVYGRGDLIAVADETWQKDIYYGFIKRVNSSGGFVTSFDIYNVIELSGSSGDVSMIDSVDAVTDINTTTGSFGVAVKDRFGAVHQSAITETSDVSHITLVTPFLDSGQFSEDQPLAVGPVARVVRRMILLGKEKSGEETWKLTLLPEAPEVHT